ncbi:AbiH family protein [Imperialibacter sp.]|uniref:AbiH family protein n=1 Tax=Imperialibacter sp. TaxID=2038411 RepID=UPI0032EBFD1D
MVILGNGFDLAHGLPTSYSSFILDYFKSAYIKAVSTQMPYTDDLIELRLQHLLPELERANDLKKASEILVTKKIVTYKNRLLRSLLEEFHLINWVDIENTYYSLLKKYIPAPDKIDSFDKKGLESLNRFLEEIKALLRDYLDRCVKTNIGEWRFLINEFVQIFNQEFSQEEIQSVLHENCKKPSNIYFLNFNYTGTIGFYSDQMKVSGRVINIHGQLNDENNPPVFGFGDELDERYADIERLNQNELFRHIKSFAYFQTTNYQRLLRVIDSNPFQVFIIGHSCGLSDRTMLNYIFESENCKSIKIFHYKDKDHFVTTTQEISRHFRDKASMRSKIVPFDKQNRCPQVTDDF